MNTYFENFGIFELDTNRSSSFYKLISNNKTRLEDYFAGIVAKNKTLKDTEGFCKAIEQKAKEKNYFPFVITNSVDHTLIGFIDVKNIDWSVPKAEIGYFIDQNYEGKGIITKAVTHLIEYLTNEYHFKKLLCRANSQNSGSIKVALKNGFEYEGTIRNDYRTTNNEIIDLNYYGKCFKYNQKS